ncbi:MAG: hypothetical protein ABIJ34_09475 [archaeon]
MKRTISIFIALLLIFSVAAVAEQNSDAGQNNEGSEDINVEELSQDVAETAKDSPNCAGYLKEQFPNVRPARIEAACERLKSKLVAAKLQTQDRIQALKKITEEKRQMLSNMAADRRLKFKAFSDEQLGKLNDMKKEAVEKLADLNKNRIKKCLEDDTESCLDKYRINKFQTKAEMFRNRVVAKVQEFKEKMQQLRNRFRELKNETQDERENFQETIKSGDETRSLEAGKIYFNKVADLVLNNLEKIKTSAEENDDLTEEELAEIVSEMDAEIAEIVEVKAAVDAATTKKELKDAASGLVSKWKMMQERLRLHVEYLERAKVQDVMKRSNYLERKLESGLAKLEVKGYDVSEVTEMVSDFSSLLEQTRENYMEGDALFREARNMAREGADRADVKEKIDAGKELIKQAREELQQAHELSKEILAKIREIAGSIDVVTEETTDDYVQVEEVDEIESVE